MKGLPTPEDKESTPGVDGLEGEKITMLKDVELSKSFLELLGIVDFNIPENITIDRYGFEVPPEAVKDFKIEEKRYEKTLKKQRTLWKNFLANTNVESHIQHHTPELMKIVKKGIPFEMRGQVCIFVFLLI